MECVEFRKAHSAMMDGRVSWLFETGEVVQRPVFGGDVLGSLIVGLNFSRATSAASGTFCANPSKSSAQKCTCYGAIRIVVCLK